VIKVGPSAAGTYKLTAKPVTTYTKTGALTGTATATLKIISATTSTITHGKLTAANGTGGQAGHSVSDTFSGAGNPSTGNYKITYTGTYR
jgi:hypothetical protein